MPVTPWDELTRSEQRLLIRLFGAALCDTKMPGHRHRGLRQRALIDDEQKLSLPGLLMLTLVMREHQADAQRPAEAWASQGSHPPDIDQAS